MHTDKKEQVYTQAHQVLGKITSIIQCDISDIQWNKEGKLAKESSKGEDGASPIFSTEFKTQLFAKACIDNSL